MTLATRDLARLAAIALLLTLVACGHGKRRPALAAPGEGVSVPLASEETIPAQPVDEGPDLWPIESDYPAVSDMDANLPEGSPFPDIHFAYDSAALSAEARSILNRHAAWLRSRPEARVVIEGHCDERGTVEYNLALGEQRARAARDYLVDLGLAPERLRTVSYGKERPLDLEQTEEAYARNRRAHLAFDR